MFRERIGAVFEWPRSLERGMASFEFVKRGVGPNEVAGSVMVSCRIVVPVTRVRFPASELFFIFSSLARGIPNWGEVRLSLCKSSVWHLLVVTMVHCQPIWSEIQVSAFISRTKHQRFRDRARRTQTWDYQLPGMWNQTGTFQPEMEIPKQQNPEPNQATDA